MKIPERAEYLLEQKHQGRRIMGVLPALYPRELLWAFDLLPAEIWDPPGDILAANAHLQTSICPIVKRSLQLILKAPETVSEGYLFPHTCDSLQNLSTLVRDLIQIDQPVRSFYNPKSMYNRASKQFYEESLYQLVKDLEHSYGPLVPAKLDQACVQSRRRDDLTRKLMQARLADRLALGNLDYFKLLRAGEYLLNRDYLPLLEEALTHIQPQKLARTRLLVSGILPPHSELLVLLDSLGVSIVADDLLSGSRRIPLVSMDPPTDPFAFITDRFFLLPPCSTRANSVQDRLQHIQNLAEQGAIDGVLLYIVTFCEPELFDRQALMHFFKKQGMPLLQLETELEPGISGQTTTRIEAFIELLQEGVPV